MNAKKVKRIRRILRRANFNVGERRYEKTHRRTLHWFTPKLDASGNVVGKEEHKMPIFQFTLAPDCGRAVHREFKREFA